MRPAIPVLGVLTFFGLFAATAAAQGPSDQEKAAAESLRVLARGGRQRGRPRDPGSWTSARAVPRSRHGASAHTCRTFDAWICPRNRSLMTACALAGPRKSGIAVTQLYWDYRRRLWRRLKNLKKLRQLNLNHTKVDGSGLVHLAGLPELDYLVMWETSLDDKGTTHLAALRGLKTLWFPQTRVTDAGLASIKDLTQLEDLILPVEIGDAGFAQSASPCPP